MISKRFHSLPPEEYFFQNTASPGLIFNLIHSFPWSLTLRWINMNSSDITVAGGSGGITPHFRLYTCFKWYNFFNFCQAKYFYLIYIWLYFIFLSMFEKGIEWNALTAQATVIWIKTHYAIENYLEKACFKLKVSQETCKHIKPSIHLSYGGRYEAI